VAEPEWTVVPVADFDARPLALHDELECGALLVEAGLTACRALKPPGEDFYTPMFLLSNGFERLLKAAICYALLEEHGEFPSMDSWKPGKWQIHSPRRLLADLLILVQVPGSRAQGVFSRADDETTVLGQIWRVIDEHSEAQSGRYHMLDVVLGRRSLVWRGRLAPADEWKQVESDLASSMILAETVEHDEAGMEKAFALSAAVIADEVGWLAWAIALMFKKWSLGFEAQLFSDVVEPLLRHKPPIRLAFTLPAGGPVDASG
jgi:hypothetical protein